MSCCNPGLGNQPVALVYLLSVVVLAHVCRPRSTTLARRDRDGAVVALFLLHRTALQLSHHQMPRMP